MATIIDKSLVKSLDPKNLYAWSKYAEDETEFFVTEKFSSLIFEGSAAALEQASKPIFITQNSGSKNAYVKYYTNGLGYFKSGENTTVYSHSLNVQNVEFNTIYGGAVMSAKENTISVNTKVSTNSITAVGDVSITLANTKVSKIYGGGAGTGSSMKGDVAITLSNVNAGNIYGGGYKSGDSDGNVVITLNGSKAGNVYGGGYQSDVNGNVLITLSDTKVSTVYGGGYQGDVYGNVEIIIDSEKAKNVGNIYVGSDNGTVTGDANVRFTATKNVSSYRGTIIGRGRGGKASLTGKSTLLFSDVSGDFNGKLKNFDNLVIEGSSFLNFKQGQDKSMRTTSYQFIVNDDTVKNSSGSAMLTWNKNIQINNVTVKLDTIDSNILGKSLSLISSTCFTKDSSFDTGVITVLNAEGDKVFSGFYDISYTPYNKKTKMGGTVTLTYPETLTFTEDSAFSEKITATNMNESVIIAEGVTFKGNVDLCTGNDTLIVKAGAIVSGFVTMNDGDDTVVLKEGSSVAGCIDLGKGSDTININGYLNSLKLGAGTNTIVINGCLNADNIQIDGDSKNTFELKGKLAADTLSTQTAQQFIVNSGENTLFVDSNDGVSDIIMGGEYAKVVFADAAGFGSAKAINLSAAKASLLEINGNISKLNFHGSTEDSTIFFSGDTTLKMDSIADIRSGCKLVIADGVKVTISDCDKKTLRGLDLQLGNNSVFEGSDFILRCDNSSGIIGTDDVVRVEEDIYVTNLTDAVIYTSGKVVVSGTVTGSNITAKEIVLNNAVIDNTTIIFGAEKVSAVAGKNTFNGALIEKGNSQYVLTDLSELSVYAGAELTIGADAKLGKVAELYADASADVTIDQTIKIDTLNVYGNGDFDFKGAKLDVGTLHFGCTVNDKFIAFNGNVDKLADSIEQSNLDVIATDSVLKFSKDADLTENFLHNTKYELTDTVLELADGVTVTLEKEYKTTGESQSVSAKLIGTFGVKGGTISGNISVIGTAPDGQPALITEGATFNDTVTAQNIADLNSTFKGNVKAEKEITAIGSTFNGNVEADSVTMNGVTMAKEGDGAEIELKAAADAGILVSNSTITAKLTSRKIRVEQSTINSNIVNSEMELTLDDAVVNGNIGTVNTLAQKVVIEDSCTVSGFMDVDEIVSGKKAGTLKVDTIRATRFGDTATTASECTAAIEANKIVARGEDIELHNNISLTAKDILADSVHVNEGCSAELNAAVDAKINVDANAVLGGTIAMVEDVEDIGTHNIILQSNAKLNGTVSGNVILENNACIGAILTGNVNCMSHQLNLANKAEIKGVVSDYEGIFVEDGSATVEDIGNNNLDKVFGNLTVTKTITDTRDEITLGRVSADKIPVYNAAVKASQSVELKNNSVVLEAASGTKDSINGQVNAANELVLQAADSLATLTLSDIKATKLTIGENTNVTGAADITNAVFGVTNDIKGVIADVKIDGDLKFTGSENTATLVNKKAIVGGNTTFENELTVEFTNEADSIFDSKITATDITSKILNVNDLVGNAELGIIDMGKALDENEYAHEPYIQAGLNKINVNGNGLNEVKFAEIKSEGNLQISVTDTKMVVTDTIVHTNMLTLTGDIEANVSANSLKLIDTEIKGDVAGKTITVNEAEINGTLTIETSLYLNGNLAVVNDDGDAAAINGDFSLMTSNKNLTGNLTGNITLGDNLYLEGDANGIVTEAASRWVSEITDNNTIVISGNAASVNLGEGTDDFTAATVGALTSGTGSKTVTVKKGSTGAIDFSNADTTTILLGDGLQAVEFGTVAGSKGADTVTITPVTESIHDEFYTITGFKTSSFAGFDFSAITENAAYGAEEPAEDTLTNAGSVSAEVTSVKFVNLKVTGKGFNGDFYGADLPIAGKTSVASTAQDPESIGEYGPAGTPAATEVGAIYKDILNVEADITGTVDMGKGADVLNVAGNRKITKVIFGTSESNVVGVKGYADENYDSLSVNGSLTTEGIEFSGNLVIDAQKINTAAGVTSRSIANTVNAASAEYVATYGNDPSNPAWTSESYTVMADETTAFGELKFNFNADKTAVESIEFVANKDKFDVINGKDENVKLTIDQELTITGNATLANGGKLILNSNLTLTGLAAGGNIVTAYGWNGKAFEAKASSTDIKYTNIGDLNFSGDGTVEFTSGKTLTANTINAGGSLTFVNAGSISSIDKIKVAEAGILKFKDDTLVALDTDLYLDWMDQALETFVLQEDVQIDDISKVLADTNLYVKNNGVGLTFEASSAESGKFIGKGYEVTAELSPDKKNIALTYATLA